MNNDEEGRVAGSNPAACTTFPGENCEIGISDTVSTHETQQNSEAENSTEVSNWPRRVKHRNKVLATVYRPLLLAS
jgi:hypothetical protein